MSAKVAKKILEVMNRVQYLKKDGAVKFGQTNYAFLSEEKITQAISKARIEVGLAILPIDVEEDYESGKRSRVKVTYLFIDSESGETLTAKMIGQGVDSQDKSANKALTQAWKYLQRQTFGIATGDDPDHVSSEELDAQDKAREEKERQRQIEAEQARLELEDNTKNLYKQLKGSMEGYEELTTQLLQKGNSLKAINEFFSNKLQERTKTQ